MKSIYRRLTKDQKERNVIFSSQLRDRYGNNEDAVVHEVFSDDPDKFKKIEHLKDASFFNGSKWNVNEIRK